MKGIKEYRTKWRNSTQIGESEVSSSKVSKGDSSNPMAGNRIGGYILCEKIGQGSFGIVYEGRPEKSTRKVAIKIELIEENKYSQLENENEIYKKLEGIGGFPRIEFFGVTESYRYLVMEYLGMSLEDMLAIRNRKFCVKTVFIVAKRMIDLIEQLHSIGYIHRDLKPDNFLIGRDPKKLFLIDLGMAKEYCTCGNNHITPGSGKKLAGTPRYASLNAHKGLELSRRDDLESIGYIILYLAKGKLPWQGLKESKRDRCRIIGEIKRTLKIEEIAKEIPGGHKIIDYFTYVKSLQFDTAPNYTYLRTILDGGLQSNGLVDDGIFEWEYVFKGSLEDIINDSLEEEKGKKKGIFKRLKKLFCKCFM
ncbi:hypothetical protein NEOKW01_0843 [Nematocida sp. AWRm80]|nr:hypothetical protein NEOKW01_0843 [Nematocida sp. AWRm80]